MTYSRTLSIILVPIASLILTSCTSQQTPIARSNPTHIEKVVENTSSTSTGTTAIGSTVTMEAINGISVPPEPDAVLNNATLAGVDVNNNGVRDDVERIIAQSSSSKMIFDTSILYVKKLSSLIFLPTPSTNEEATKMMLSPECVIEGNSQYLVQIHFMQVIFNTPERMTKIKAISKLVPAMTAQDVKDYDCRK